MDDPALADFAEETYRALIQARREVLFDDRQETPGVKFNDADLIGLPLRVTVSPRTMREDQVELKPRVAKEFRLFPRKELLQRVDEALAAAP
jgi:prolyl-tRNA synthetase